MAVLLMAACSGEDPPSPVLKSDPERLPFLEMGSFDYEEGMTLPETVTKWDGKYVIVSGYMKSTTQNTNLKTFSLFKDWASCCFGGVPKLNHFINVTLRDGEVIHYTPKPVTLRGILHVGEIEDAGWIEMIFRMQDAEVVR